MKKPKDKLIEELELIAKALKEKSEVTEIEAAMMKESANMLFYITKCFRNGDLDEAFMNYDNINYEEPSICHIDLYDVKDLGDDIDIVFDQLKDLYPKYKE